MFAPDWIMLGLTAMVLAVLVTGAVSTFLAWRMPMTPLAPALVAGGTAAGFVLMAGNFHLPLVLVVGGGLAAIAGLLYDRAVIGQWSLAIVEAVIAVVAVALIAVLTDLQPRMVLDWVGLPQPIVIGVGVALASLGLRRADRLPGLPAAIGGCVAAVAAFLAVWSRVAAPQPIWWLASLALVLIGLSVVSRSRADPFGAAGTSYLALTVVALVALTTLAGLTAYTS